MVNIIIPEGYQLESLSENQAMKLGNELGNYSYLIKQNGKFLQLSITFNYKNALVLTTDYETFRMYYNSFVEKLSEKIVLKKT